MARTINKENRYIKDAKKIKELCENDKHDVGVATAMYERETGYFNPDEKFEFLETVAELSLDKICEMM